jgi:ribosomal protein L11 methyltransferase
VDVVVSVVVAADDAELAADRLWAEGAAAVEERHAGDASVELVAGFPTPEAAARVARAVGGRAVEVDDRVWRQLWREHARPVRVGSMVVAPAWRRVGAVGAGPVVSIDPGPCFGSGSHPTTRLLLAELQRRVVPGTTVLDVGTGSGILAVAAAVIGAGRVVAVDLDPDAVETTRRNASANGVADRVAASVADAATVTGPFDAVVANLTAGTLARVAAVLVQAVADGGVLVVSGMLVGQWPHVAGRFAGLAVLDLPVLDGWTAAVLGKAPTPPAHDT